MPCVCVSGVSEMGTSHLAHPWPFYILILIGNESVLMVKGVGIDRIAAMLLYNRIIVNDSSAYLHSRTQSLTHTYIDSELNRTATAFLFVHNAAAKANRYTFLSPL